ncbi:MAG: hypothetical protein ACR2OG_15875 [Gemmatimonadaceae bacterium]
MMMSLTTDATMQSAGLLSLAWCWVWPSHRTGAEALRVVRGSWGHRHGRLLRVSGFSSGPAVRHGSRRQRIELPLVYATGAFALAVFGPGLYSLDGLLGLQSFWTPALSWGALAVGLGGGVLNLLARRTPPVAEPPRAG